MALQNGYLIPGRYVGAHPGDREKLVELHGKWCYAHTERAMVEYGMIELCTHADAYKERMNSFLGQKMEDRNGADRAVSLGVGFCGAMFS